MENETSTQANWDERKIKIRRALELGYSPAYEFMHAHKALFLKLEYLKSLLDDGLIERDKYLIAGIRENAKMKRLKENFAYHELEQFLDKKNHPTNG